MLLNIVTEFQQSNGSNSRKSGRDIQQVQKGTG